MVSGDLTGAWYGGDHGLYLIRQVRDQVWWAGFSTESFLGGRDFHLGVRFCNIFAGRLTGSMLVGEWVDVGRGRIRQWGRLELARSGPVLLRRGATGGFGARQWTRIPELPPKPPVRQRLAMVRRADGGSLANSVEVLADHSAVIGTVLGAVGFDWPPGASRDYRDVQRAVQERGDTRDGCVRFRLRLGSTPVAPLGITADSGLGPGGVVEANMIMYGRTADEDDSAVGGRTVLPGWMELGPNSVLWGGVPVAGAVSAPAPDRVAILGQMLPAGTEVRVCGLLGYPAGGSVQGQRRPSMHPVYSVDLLRDAASIPRSLSGTWACSDGGSYYLRQIGGTVWWLGLGHDHGRTLTSVFRGGLDGTRIAGPWADTPPSGPAQAGDLVLDTGGRAASAVRLQELSTGGRTWDKLVDAQ